MQQAAVEGEKCGACHVGVIDPETGKCDICSYCNLKATTVKDEAVKLPKGRRGGYGSFYQFHKRRQRLQLARDSR